MEITEIKYNYPPAHINAIMMCSVVFDDCMVLKDIRLCQSHEKGYFLIFPSKQNLYNELEKYNKDLGIDIEYPKMKHGKGGKKLWEEYFYPISSEFYKYMLSTVIEGYESFADDLEHEGGEGDGR